MAHKIFKHRIYDKEDTPNAYRVLVDRLWPRGVKKEDAHLDEWIKNIAPSTELRKWFDHKEERFEEFEFRYRTELKEQKDELSRLKKITTDKDLCLLYAAKNENINHVVILEEVLKELKI